MASSLSTRIWRVCKENGRPLPDLTEGKDEYQDYIIWEAVAHKALKEDEKAEETRKRDEWKHGIPKELEAMRSGN